MGWWSVRGGGFGYQGERCAGALRPERDSPAPGLEPSPPVRCDVLEGREKAV